MAKGGGNAWMLPVVAGLAIGYFISPMIKRFTHIPQFAGAAKVAPVKGVPHQAPETYPRRSFDRAYDSWLHNTVNALPTIG